MGIGSWSQVFSWPIVGIHAVLTQTGRLLTFGTNPDGSQGGAMVHDLWDPVTGEHRLIDHHMDTPTDIFCAAAIVLPGTNDILIAGGDTRPLGQPGQGVDDVNRYDDATGMIMPAADGTMNVARWYPTLISLPSGQVVVMGGIDGTGAGQGTPEIYTPGEGWRLLTGAFDPDVVASNYYPKAWVGPSGEIFYVANGDGPDNRLQLMALDPGGDGTIREVARLPFYLDWMSSAIMVETGHVLINDWRTGLWTIDLTTAAPAISRVAELADDRNYSDMTVLADGRVLINGGTAKDNLEAFAETTALIWDPATGTLSEAGDEAHARVYHSSSILLPDGTVLSLGGGSAANAENDYLDGQIYRPAYLFDANGAAAVRPVVTGAPATAMPGDTFRITVDDADAITRLTFVKTGAVTHNLNMDTREATLAFTHIDAQTLEVTLPGDRTAITAGSWMLFAWNAAGVPSVAPIIAVEPTAAGYDGVGDLTAEVFAVGAGVTSLDQVDFAATPTDHALVARVESATNEGAIRFTGTFAVEAAGTYTFSLGTDASARLAIDGVAVLSGAASAAVTLAAGIHSIDLRALATGDQSGALDLDWSGPAFARRQMSFDGTVDNLLANGSLERAAGTSGFVGWLSAGTAESHASGDLGLAAQSGGGFAEIDAATGALSQRVGTVKGADYHLGLDLAGNLGGVGSSRLVVLVNGSVLATITPGDTVWHRYDLMFTGSGSDTITLRAADGDSDSDAVGALIDTVVLTGPKPSSADCDCDIMGTAGDDTLTGTAASEEVMGIGGNDRLSGLGGRDVLEGGGGDDVLVGGRGNDLLNGQAGLDTADYSAVRGDLTLDLAIGARQSAGEAGRDRLIRVENLIGGHGDDALAGTAGANRLTGGSGDDSLQGRGGDDVLSGGKGDDRLDGGTGGDLLFGDAGRDLFVFAADASAPGMHRDVIRDFMRGEDRILGPAGATSFIGDLGFSGTAGELRYHRAGGNTVVQVDADGDGRADLEVALTGVFVLTAGDFVGVSAALGADLAGGALGSAGGNTAGDPYHHVCLA